MIPTIRSRDSRLAPGIALALAFLSLLVHPPTLSACGGKAVPTGCGRTVVLTTSVPSTFLATGGIFDIDTEIYFALAEFPGTPDCPPGPYEADLEFALTCAPSGDGIGSLLDIPVVPGFNPATVQVTLPAGPPRLCTVTGTATISSSDASTLTATNDKGRLCLVDPAPGNPSLPRLVMELLDPATGTVRTHPGEPSSHSVRVTNNDPVSSFSGEVEIRTENVAKVPGSTGIDTPGDGVFSPSDPGLGDNFPLAFGDGGQACVPLPLDPLASGVPLLQQPVLLGPGESVDLEILTRPWGMCADGSCSQTRAVVDGSFADLTDGLACSSFATITDLGADPSFLWPDTGSTVLFDLPGDPSLGMVPFLALPLPDLPPAPMFFTGLQPLIQFPPAPPQPGNLIGDLVDPERARLRSNFDLPEPIQPDVPFQLLLPIVFEPQPDADVVDIQVLFFDHMVGAPDGFGDFQPIYMGQLQVTQVIDGDPFLSVLDLTLQLHAFGLGPLGEPLDPLGLQPQGLQPLPLPPGQAGIELHVQAILAGGGQPTQAVQVDADLRLHAARGASIFASGFELGNASEWSQESP